MATPETKLAVLNEKTNFSNWKFRLKLFLEERGLENFIEINKIDNTAKDFKKNDAKVRSIIVQSTSDQYLNVIKKSETALDMVMKLESIFERKSIFNKVHLKKQLLTLKASNSEKLQDHFLKFEILINDLEAAGSKIENSDKVCHLLLTLGEEYDTVITSLETMCDDKDLSIEFVKSRLLDAEIKLKNKHSESHEQSAMLTCYKCGKEGHKSYQCKVTVQGNTNYRGRPPYRSRNNRFKRNFLQQRSYNYNAETEQDILVALSAENKLKHEQDCIIFIVDSGATHHFIMQEYEQFMTNVEELKEPITINIANGAKLIARKQGVLPVTYINDNSVKIQGLIVENLNHNLLSVNKLQESGRTVVFKHGKLKIHSKNGKKYIGVKRGNLFTLKFILHNREQQCYTTEINKSLWHLRMGHLNRKSLSIMNLPVDDKCCDTCMENKSTRLPFQPIKYAQSSKIGELIHTDVSGPHSIPTNEGYRYFHTIIDDYSHFTYTYMMKNKNEAVGNLLKYINEVEREKEVNIKRIRCDNGGEFTSNWFKNFCANKGIKLEYTSPYSPQSNGKAERMNRTLVERARGMLNETNLPKHLWNHAIMTATFLINRSPSKAIGNRIPAEIFKTKLMLDKIRVFGCKAWSHKIPPGDKFDSRAKAVRMVGYNTNGYKLWDPSTDEIIVSRDVRFDETDYKHINICQDKVEIQEILPTEEIEEGNIRTRSGREIRKPKYLDEYELYEVYCLLTKEDDPISYDEAINRNDEWKKAINKEIESLQSLETWEECELPKNRKAIDTKWVFKTKSEGIKKARLVVKGFQQDIEDYVYSPVAKMATIRLCLSHALNNDWETQQLDIPTAFLNGNVESEVYIKVPQGIVINDKGKVLKLKKALYGLKESPKCWNKTFNEFCTSIGMRRSEYDNCLYIGEDLWLLLFVDDILLIGNQEKINQTTMKLNKRFNAKNLGIIKCFLGMDIVRNNNTLTISQTKFIDKILKKFNMNECRPSYTPMETNFQVPEREEIISTVPYKEIIGCLTYLSISRPDITFATSLLSRYMIKPTKTTWEAAKRILRYLKATREKVLTYKKSCDNKVIAYSDADWGGDHTDRKSISGMVIYHNENLISWSSRKQQTVSLSSAEAEYISAAMCVSDLLFIKGLSQEFKVLDSVVLFVDNQSALKMINNSENTKRTKHIDIKFHFIKDSITKKLLSVQYVTSEQNIADVMTKPLCSTKFHYFCKLMLN